MLTTLIRRELLDNLMTFRFAVAVLIMLLLVVANTVVLLKDYEQRLMLYNDAVKTHQQKLQEKKTYSAGITYAGELRINRPPNPLSIFNTGFDKRIGNKVTVSHTYVPSLWDSGWHRSNPFMDMFVSMDIVFIFEVILSLLALVFAYDTLAGEYERGTLRLVLTHPVRRGHILLAKYISAMLCLLVPLLINLLLTVILLTTTPSISLNTDDFLRIGGLILASVAYLSVFYLIGLLISAATRRTSTALMLAMFVWGFLVLVYPNVILAVIPRSEAPQARAASAFSQIEQMWEEEFKRERRHFLETDALPRIDWLGLRGSGAEPYAYFWGDPQTLLYSFESILAFEGFDEKEEHKIPHVQNHFRFLGRLVIRTADQTWLIRKPALEDIFIHPANVKRIWLKLSPVGLYDAATQAWTSTDLHGVRDFFDAARRYRQEVINVLYDKEAFGSRQWFSSDKGAADWSILPQFSFQRVDVNTNAKRALPDVSILLMMNVVIFILIFLIFVKSEV